MFTATWGSQVLYDPRTDDFRLMDQQCTAGLTDASSYTFTMPPDHPLAGLIEPMDKKREVVLYDDGAEVFRGRVLTVESGFDGCATYSCEGVRAYLNDAHCEPYRCGEAGVPSDAAGMFAWYVGQYNRVCGAQGTFEVGVNDGRELCRDALSIEEGGRPGVWDQIRSNLVDAYGGVVRVRTEGERRYIDWLADGTRECGQRVEFGVNLTDFLHTCDASGAATRVVPFSAGVRAEGDEEDPPDTLIGGTPDRALAYGYRKVGDAVVDVEAEERRGVVEVVLDCGEGKPADEMVQAAVQELRNRALGDTVEASTVDLHKVDPSVERISVGDLVRVTSLPHGFDAVMMCREAVYRPDDACATLTLGAGTPRLTRVQASRDRRAAAALGAGLYALGQGVDAAGSLASAANDRAAGLAVEMEVSRRVIAEVREELGEAAKAAGDAMEAAGSASAEAAAAQESAEAAAEQARGAASEAALAREEAAGALSGAQEALDGFKADAATTYATKAEVTESEERVSSEMSRTYVNKDQVGTTLVTRSQLDQAAEGISASVAEEFDGKLASYATRADLKVSADGVLQSVSQNYLDKATGATLATKAEVQTSASGVLSTVASQYLTKEGAKAYATSSQLSQTADAIRAEVSEGFEDAAKTYATSSQLAQTAASIRSEISQGYVSKETGATYATKSELTQSAESVLSQVASNYVDKETGKTLATSSQLAQTAKDIRAEVSHGFEDAAKTYATSAQLTQTAAAIRSEVSSGYVDKATGSTYATKSELTSTAAGIRSDVSSTYLTKAAAQSAYTSKTELAQTSEAFELSIEKVSSRVLFGTCSTAGATAAKTVEIADFKLRTGAAVSVLFTNANSAQSPTLDVSGTGAKPVRLYGTSTFGTTVYSWVASAVVQFVYDGTYWRIADSASMYRMNQAITETRNNYKAIKTLIRADDDGVTVGQSADDGATYTSARTRAGTDGTFSVLAKDGSRLMALSSGSLSLDIGQVTTGTTAPTLTDSRLWLGRYTDTSTSAVVSGLVDTSASGNMAIAASGSVTVYSSWRSAAADNKKGASRSAVQLKQGQGMLMCNDASGTHAASVRATSEGVVSLTGKSLNAGNQDGSKQKTADMGLFVDFLTRLANGTMTYTMGSGSKLAVNYMARTATIEMGGAQTVTIPASSDDGWKHISLGTLGATYRPPFTLRFNLLDIYGLGGCNLYCEIYGKNEANAGQVWVVNPQPKQFSGYLHGCCTWVY